MVRQGSPLQIKDQRKIYEERVLRLRHRLGTSISDLRQKSAPKSLGLASVKKRRCLGQITTPPRISSPHTGSSSVKLPSLGAGCLQRRELFITGGIKYNMQPSHQGFGSGWQVGLDNLSVLF